MRESLSSLARAGRWLALALLAAFAGVACAQAVAQAPTALFDHPTAIFSQAVAQSAARPPQAALSPTPAPSPVQQAILIDTPPGTQVGSPVVITGHTTCYPTNGMLS